MNISRIRASEKIFYFICPKKLKEIVTLSVQVVLPICCSR